MFSAVAHRLTRLIVVFIGALALPGIALSADPEASTESLLETQLLIAHQIKPQSFRDEYIADQAFAYDLNTNTFDLGNYLKREAPHLLEHEEAISHWSGYASINPKMALTLMEQQSRVLSNPSKESLARPFGGLSSEHGFTNQFRDVITRISQRFYNIRALQLRQKDSNREPQLTAYLPDGTAASLTLASIMTPASDGRFTPADSNDFLDVFRRLFPGDAEAVVVPPMAASLTARSEELRALQSHIPPSNFMQMPWHQGYWWIPNGAHSHTGSGYPLSSIDFSYSWPRWGGPTYSVAAAHGGTVRVLSSCQVRVTHSSGWATNYYHLQDITVFNGQQVSRNTKLGNYARYRNQALCQGGSSTGPHLHFSLLYNGMFHSLQGVHLGPYRVNVGRWNYDANCWNYWLDDAYANRRRCAWNSIYNYGAMR